MDEVEFAQTVLEVIRSHLLYFDEKDELALDQNLNDLGLDSMAKVNIILDIEQAIGVTVPDEMLVERHFGTPGAIIDTITACSERQTAARAGLPT